MRLIKIENICESEINALGGWRIVDVAWSAVSDALRRNPYSCQSVEGDLFTLVRYIISDPVGDCPAIVWVFVIEADKSVTVVDVQKYEPF